MAQSVDDLALDILRGPDEPAVTYLRHRWLGMVMADLRQARRDAGLSQAEVAERLGTTQSAIARLERDHDGSISLHRLVDYVLACGVLPEMLSLRPIAEVRQMAIKALESKSGGG